MFSCSWGRMKIKMNCLIDRCIVFYLNFLRKHVLKKRLKAHKLDHLHLFNDSYDCAFLKDRYGNYC